MLKKNLCGILVFLALPCFAGPANQNLSKEKIPVAEQEEQTVDVNALSEAFGNFLGKALGNPEQGIDLNIEKVIEGIRSGAAGKPSPLTEEEYQKGMALLKEKVYEAKAQSNLKEAENFLKKNEKDRDVAIIIKDKLQYKILNRGDGSVVSESATPKIHYTGRFVDGTIFGSSEQTGPIAIPLAQTIPGFRKGIAGMIEGEKRRLFIHPELAYGKYSELPPNMLLIFDIEVVEADTKQDQGASQEDEDLFELE